MHLDVRTVDFFTAKELRRYGLWVTTEKHVLNKRRNYRSDLKVEIILTINNFY